eukprot:TRINITY_DN1870_c0_g1_i6.p1 TRINITY_DN1870_c0_g1~~TRINITY_DN1870_c0_g1_i6.p1  ORF type:complete len:733 (-),score=155.94 TRINITY_DN1870_c0_g1_i6:130-2223(-)
MHNGKTVPETVEDAVPLPKAPAKKPRIIANLFNTDYDIVKEVIKSTFGFRIAKNPEGDWDLLWADTGVTDEMLAKVRSYQKINHYPSMWCITRKNHLGKNLMRMRREHPGEYNFFPPTWLLPCDWNDFRSQFAQRSAKTYIVKPEALSQGKGIFLTRSCDTLDPNEHFVVQRYINKPYLIEGLKFDLRIYVLVYGCDPLRVYIFKEGLARLATKKYVPPNGTNMEDMFVHLTNYAVNKFNDDYVFNESAENADVGHKRSLSFVWKYVDDNGGDSRELRRRIEEAIVKTLCAVQPQLAYSYRACQPLDDKNNKCFEILGFDVLIDHKLKPWLLEVNHSPSFSTDTPFDEKVKLELLADTITLLHLDPMKRIKHYQKKNAGVAKRYLNKGVKKYSKEERKERKMRHMEKRDKYEMEHCGNYTRIYPDLKDCNKYENFIETARRLWDKLYGPKVKKEVSEAVSKSSLVPERKQLKKPNDIKVPKQTSTDNQVMKTVCNTERGSGARVAEVYHAETAQKRRDFRDAAKQLASHKYNSDSVLHLPSIEKKKEVVNKTPSGSKCSDSVVERLDSSVSSYPTKEHKKFEEVKINERADRNIIRIIKKDELYTSIDSSKTKQSTKARITRKATDLSKLNLNPKDLIAYMKYPVEFPISARHKPRNTLIASDSIPLNGRIGGTYVMPKVLEFTPKGFIMQDWKSSK